ASRRGSAELERSQRHTALRRRTAGLRRLDGPGVPAEVRENPLDRCGLLDAGDDPQPAAAVPAGLDVDGEYPLEALRPCQGPLLTDASRSPRVLGTTRARSGLAGANTPW